MIEGFDQTQFMTEEPLYEKPVKIQPVPDGNLDVQSSTKSKRKWVIISVVAVMTLLLLVVVVAAMRRPQSLMNDEAVAPEATSVEMGPFMQQLEELEDELQLADPNRDETPFPPVNMEIRLED